MVKSVIIHAIALTISAESDNSSESMDAVAEVIAVRMQESGKTALAVVKSKRQFCCWSLGSEYLEKHYVRQNTFKWDYSMYLARLVVDKQLPISNQRFNHFYKIKLNKPAPYWAKYLKNKENIGTQMFGRLDKWRK